MVIVKLGTMGALVIIGLLRWPRDQSRVYRARFVTSYLAAAMVTNGYRLAWPPYQAFVAPAVAVVLALGMEVAIARSPRRLGRGLMTAVGVWW